MNCAAARESRFQSQQFQLGGQLSWRSPAKLPNYCGAYPARRSTAIAPAVVQSRIIMKRAAAELEWAKPFMPMNGSFGGGSG
jgi:hypothetical protein